MKKILYLILLLPFLSWGQSPVSPVGPVQTGYYHDTFDGSTWLNQNTPPFNYGWLKFGSGGGTTVPGGPITTIPIIGTNPGTSLSAGQWIINAFYGTQTPTAGLTGGVNLEISASSSSSTLNWSYGRQSATATIASVVINPGSFNVFGSQPPQPGSINGTQSVTIPATGSITFTETVTTTDSKTATSSTTYNRLPNAYWGRTVSSSPPSSIIIAVAGGGNILSSSRSQIFTVTASGSNFIYFAYPSSEGALTSLTVGGFQSLPAFTQSTVSVTNASGFVQNYFVYVSNNTFSATTPTIITL